MSKPELIILDDASAMETRAAEEIVHVSGEAICTHGQFSLCLTGGGTPAGVYSLMATRFHLSVDWKEVHFFWGDERCVSPNHEASNFGMAHRTMLSALQLRSEQIHRMKGEDPPEKAARHYEDHLKSFFGLDDGEFPRFDLMLLGLGDNAHIASLFPHHPALHEGKRLCVPVEVDAPQRHRLTLTSPVINNSARIMFMVCGENKADAVRAVLEGPRDIESYPAQLVDPRDGTVTWVLDKAAASKLSNR